MQFTLCSELCLFCRHLPCLAVDTNTIVCEHRFCPCLLTFHLVLNIFIRFLFFFLHSCSTLFAFSLILDSLTLWPFWLSARWKHGPATIAGRYETVDSVDYDKRKWTKKIKKISTNRFQKISIPTNFHFIFFTITNFAEFHGSLSGTTGVAWKQRAAGKGAPRRNFRNRFFFCNFPEVFAKFNENFRRNGRILRFFSTISTSNFDSFHFSLFQIIFR